MSVQEVVEGGSGTGRSWVPGRLKGADHWETVRKLSVDGYVGGPVLDAGLAHAIYEKFDEVIGLAAVTDWADTFNAVAQDWKVRERSSLSHSGFFAPYFRDRNGRDGADQKAVYQTCSAFGTELLTHAGDRETGSPYPSPVRELDGLLDAAADEVTPALQSVLSAIVRAEPALVGLVYARDRRPILTARVIKYTPDRLAGTNPHVDKTALSCVLHNSDGPSESNLVLAPPVKRRLAMSEFAPAPSGESVIFPGQAFVEAGFGLLRATPHAVLPVGVARPRYSLVVFCLMQGVDLTDFDTTVAVDDDLQVLRAYRSKANKAGDAVTVGAEGN